MAASSNQLRETFPWSELFFGDVRNLFDEADAGAVDEDAKPSLASCRFVEKPPDVLIDPHVASSLPDSDERWHGCLRCDRLEKTKSVGSVRRPQSGASCPTRQIAWTSSAVDRASLVHAPGPATEHQPCRVSAATCKDSTRAATSIPTERPDSHCFERAPSRTDSFP